MTTINTIESEKKTTDKATGSVAPTSALLSSLNGILSYFDCLAVGLSAILASEIAGHFIPEITAQAGVYKYLFPATISVFLFYYITQKQNNFYNIDEKLRFLDFTKIAAWLMATFMIILSFGMLLQVAHTYSSIWFAVWFSISFSVIVLFHASTQLTVSYFAEKGTFNKRIAIIAPTKENAHNLRDELLKSDFGIGGITIFNDRQTDQLIASGQNNEIDQIIIAYTRDEEHLLIEIADKLQVLPLELHVCLCDQKSQISAQSYQKLGDLELQLINAKPIDGWKYTQKAVLDYSVAIVSLIVFAPVMLLIAIAIKLDSSGPVFFRQKRHGYNHNQIDVFKFRTMTVMENGSEIRQAQKNDSRVTFVGKFLRKTSLDELPQLFNVLRGEMSVVGPRPHALAHNHQYSSLISKYANRHKVKPGITGWAQVNGYRGPTEDIEDMKKRAEFDLQYIDNWSIWLDFKILLVTPVYGFIGKNAF
ncbi:MAG: undecaprenyl-phosphate glucose phosphotransferase [Methyloligellaceae bacterium]